jgi:hypothetical protein
MRLLVQNVAQNTKNPTLALLPPILILTIGGGRGGGNGGSQYCIEPSGGGIQFTGEKHKLTMLLMYLIFSHMANSVIYLLVVLFINFRCLLIK